MFCLDALGPSNILGSLESKYLHKLTTYLNPVIQSSSRSRFVRCWHAKTDGWAASTFHRQCDTRVLQSPSLKSTIISLVDTLTCLGLVSIIYYSAGSSICCGAVRYLAALLSGLGVNASVRFVYPWFIVFSANPVWRSKSYLSSNNHFPRFQSSSKKGSLKLNGGFFCGTSDLYHP